MGVRFPPRAQKNVEQNLKNLISSIPKEVSHVTETLENAGFRAYLVGGCVRDLLMEREPKDWDVTTNATPEQVMGLFEKTIYENNFGTVGVCVPISENVARETEPHLIPLLKGEEAPSNSQEKAGDEVNHETSKYLIVEVTPHRTEAKYSDFRHPDDVVFTENIEDDLKRRDFTVNAMAIRHIKGQVSLMDMFGGVKDIKDKTLRCVETPDDRFTEDALRMLRAVRFACQLDFSVSHETTESILKNTELIKKISSERIREEFVKIIMSKNGSSGIVMLQKFGLLKNIIPE